MFKSINYLSEDYLPTYDLYISFDIYYKIRFEIESSWLIILNELAECIEK